MLSDDVAMAHDYVTITDDDGTHDDSIAHDYVTIHDDEEAVTNSWTDTNDYLKQESKHHTAKSNDVI